MEAIVARNLCSLGQLPRDESNWPKRKGGEDRTITAPTESKSHHDETIWTINKLFAQTTAVDFNNKPKKEKKVKPKRYQSHSRHFRILKNDIRKSYAAMVANILNSSDFKLIRNFFETFGLPDVDMDFRHDPFGSFDPNYRVNGNFNAKFTGADLIACIMGAFPNSAPDYAFEVEDAQIRIRSDSDGSIITTSYISRASYVYEFNLNEIAKELLNSFAIAAPRKSHQSLPSTTEATTQPCKRVRMEDERDNEGDELLLANDEEEGKELLSGFESFVKKMAELEIQHSYSAPTRVPFIFTVRGECTIQLDELQRIENISFTRFRCTSTTFAHNTCV